MRAALEYNNRGCMLFSLDCPGAFARAASREEAVNKLPAEVAAFCRWSGGQTPTGPVCIQEEKYQPELSVEDADGDMIFDQERRIVTETEYLTSRTLILRSARDLDQLYASIPDPDRPLAPPRKTFYGECPNTARKMFEHTNGVTGYYVGELGAQAPIFSSCYETRLAGLAAVENLPDFLNLPVREGSYGEEWSLKKVLRRFLWHDRIHARAMYRRARGIWGGKIADPFRLEG